jgi:hypothetical protein
MTTYYLLPCSCGKKTEVDSGQAGLNLRCSCGAELAVPTMRGLNQLERAAEPPAGRRPVASPQSRWGARQALIFLGLVILLGVLPPAVLVWYTYPPRPQLVDNFQEMNRDDIDRMALLQTWELWKGLRKDFADETEMPLMQVYQVLEKAARTRATIVATIGGIGLLLIVAGLLVKKPARREAG